MNIFYTCTTESLVKDYQFHHTIINNLKNEGHVLTYDWIDEAYENLTKGVIGNTEEFYSKKIDAIKAADIVIVEGSYKSFSIGHQITISAQKAKPTLLLSKKDHGGANKKTSYIEGIKSAWLVNETYHDADDAIAHIDTFQHVYKRRRKYRFNLVISLSENYFLEEKMRATGKTKTDLVRMLIKADMKK